MIGGLVSSTVPGVLIHTNTIEEYRALDLDAIVKQQQALTNEQKPNRFIVLLFGDLKNYKYFYRYAILEMDTTKVNQTYANIVGTLVKEPNLTSLAAAIGQFICRD